MKKKVLFTIVCMIMSYNLNVHAQSYYYPSFHMGIRGGVTFTKVVDYNYLKGKTAPYGGLAFDFRLAQIPLYLETGLYYMDRGYTIDYKKWLNDDPEFNHFYDFGGWSLPDEEKVSYCFLNLPILFSYHYYVTGKMALQPFAGGFIGYNIDTTSSHNYRNRFEGGVRVGLGVNYGRLYVNVGYDIGLFKSEGDIKMNALFLTLGFNIVGSR